MMRVTYELPMESSDKVKDFFRWIMRKQGNHKGWPRSFAKAEKLAFKGPDFDVKLSKLQAGGYKTVVAHFSADMAVITITRLYSRDARYRWRVEVSFDDTWQAYDPYGYDLMRRFIPD